MSLPKQTPALSGKLYITPGSNIGKENSMNSNRKDVFYQFSVILACVVEAELKLSKIKEFHPTSECLSIM